MNFFPGSAILAMYTADKNSLRSSVRELCIRTAVVSKNLQKQNLIFIKVKMKLDHCYFMVKKNLYYVNLRDSLRQEGKTVSFFSPEDDLMEIETRVEVLLHCDCVLITEPTRFFINNFCFS